MVKFPSSPDVHAETLGKNRCKQERSHIWFVPLLFVPVALVLYLPVRVPPVVPGAVVLVSAVLLGFGAFRERSSRALGKNEGSCSGSLPAGRNKGRRTLLIALAAGSVLAVVVSPRPAVSGTGFPSYKIESVRVRTTEDFSKTGRGDFVGTAELERSYAHDGSSASASGRLLVFLEAKEDSGSVPGGKRIELNGRPAPAPEDMEADYLVYAGAADPPRDAEEWPVRAAALRSAFLEQMYMRADLSGGRAAPLITALLTGDRSDLSPAALRRYREAGVMHLFALSGMHLGIVAAIILLIAAPFTGRARAVYPVAAILGIYVFLTGMRASMLRAWSMYGMYVFARAAGRRPGGLRVLLLTALVLALFLPQAAGSLSFQLSAMALLGILSLGMIIDELLRPWLPVLVRVPLALSLGAVTANAPLLAYAFGEFYPAGVLASLVLTPLVTLFIWTALPAVVLAPVEDAAALSRPFLELAARLIERGAGLFGRFPGINGIEQPWPFFVLPFFAVGITVAGTRMIRKRKGNRLAAMKVQNEREFRIIPLGEREEEKAA
ncbi:MAG: ComEC/Rec2 family competence protein [Spirochaetales bacterium]|nr:ComEC/Rec2 family competence protein [Spirochaetales bacterium]MCF7937097.1 ComEC/Rec2 family competence protein [Spirochaetales bacterium]